MNTGLPIMATYNCHETNLQMNKRRQRGISARYAHVQNYRKYCLILTVLPVPLVQSVYDPITQAHIKYMDGTYTRPLHDRHIDL